MSSISEIGNNIETVYFVRQFSILHNFMHNFLTFFLKKKNEMYWMCGVPSWHITHTSGGSYSIFPPSISRGILLILIFIVAKHPARPPRTANSSLKGAFKLHARMRILSRDVFDEFTAIKTQFNSNFPHNYITNLSLSIREGREGLGKTVEFEYWHCWQRLIVCQYWNWHEWSLMNFLRWNRNSINLQNWS